MNLGDYLTKIFWDRDSFYTTFYLPTKRENVPFQNMNGSCIDLEKYPNLYRLILQDMKFCFRYQKNQNQMRVFLEKSIIDGDKLKNLEIIASYGETLEDAAQNLEEKCALLEREK